MELLVMFKALRCGKERQGKKKWDKVTHILDCIGRFLGHDGSEVEGWWVKIRFFLACKGLRYGGS